MTRNAVAAKITTDDLVALTRADGKIFIEPVVEIRAGGVRLNVRAGFASQDLFIAFGDIVKIVRL